MEHKPDRLQGLLWAMFAQTALITAIIAPVHILVQGVLAPLHLVPAVDSSYSSFAAALSNPLVKVYLFVLFSTSFYVFGHRTRYLLLDLGVHGGKLLVGLLMYGIAAVGAIAAALVLLNVP